MITNFFGVLVKNGANFPDNTEEAFKIIYDRFEGVRVDVPETDLSLFYYKDPKFGQHVLAYYLEDGNLYQIGVTNPYALNAEGSTFNEIHAEGLGQLKKEEKKPEPETPAEPKPEDPKEEPKEPEKSEEPKEEPTPEEPKPDEPKPDEPEVPAEPNPSEPEPEKPGEEPEEPKGPESLLNGVRVVIKNDLDDLAVKALEGKEFTLSEDGKVRIYELLKALAVGEITVELFFHELETGVLSKAFVNAGVETVDLIGLRKRIEAVIAEVLNKNPNEATPR